MWAWCTGVFCLLGDEAGDFAAAGEDGEDGVFGPSLPLIFFAGEERVEEFEFTVVVFVGLEERPVMFLTFRRSRSGRQSLRGSVRVVCFVRQD